MGIKRILGVGLFCLGGLIAVVWPAAAEQFSMSGLYRNYCCSKLELFNDPTSPLLTPTSVFPTGYLYFSGDYAAFPFGAALDSRPAPGLPNPMGGPGATGRSFGLGAYPASITRPSGLVSQMGLPLTTNNRGTLTLPQNAFHLKNQYVDPYHGSTWTYIITTLDLYNSPATFMSGYQLPTYLVATTGSGASIPGSYSFCRAAPGSGSPPPPPALTPCTIPGQANAAFPWQMRVVQSGKAFGGTMGLLGVFQGIAKFKPPNLGGVNRNVYFNNGGASTGRGVPAINPLFNTIKFTSGGSGTPVSVTYTFPTPSGTTMLMFTQFPNVSYQTGGHLTTGKVYMSVTNVTDPFIYQNAQLTGSDNRTSNGQGNISLVSPMVYVNTGSLQGFPRPHRWNLTLPEPGAAIGLGAGIAALFGLGRLRRGRGRWA